MKNLFTYFVLIFCTSSLFAQEDRFHEVNQIKGKDIYIIDNSVLDVAYTVVDGKVKPIKKIKNISVSMEGKVYSIDNNVYTCKKKTYVILRGAKETILLKEEDSPLYLSSFISKTYWQEKFDLYSKDYIYLDFDQYKQIHSAYAITEYDHLTRLEWRGFELTDDGAIFYMRENGGVITLDTFKVTSAFFEENKDHIFIKNNNIQPYVDKYNERIAKEKREKEVADSIANSRVRLAIALKEAVFTDEDRTINVYEGDTLAIFSYRAVGDNYVARFHYNNLLFKPTDIEFLDSHKNTPDSKYSWVKKTVSADADYLKAKGDVGEQQRFEIAAAYDEVHTSIWLSKLKSEIDELQKELAFRKKNQIFLTGIGYVYDSNEYSNQFGMRFDIYNCFTKTIKYVEFTLTNYNAVGDVQKDDLGRSSRTVRGIGPIDPEDGGRYSWDDIFWDDRAVVDRTRLTYVKFIFTDGSTKVFSGYANINKHMTSDAWD